MSNDDVILASTYGKNRKNLTRALENALPFKTSGALRGDNWTQKAVSIHELGELSTKWANRFMIDHIAGIRYVVWSYKTPIAWIMESDNTVVIVDQKFSSTTSRHQSFLWHLGKAL